MRGKSILITWISFIVLVIIAACSGSKEEGTATLKGREISAETYTVKAKTVPIFRSFPGTVEAKAEIVLSSKVSGYVTKVAVKEGDRVTPGTILLTIDDRQIRQQIAALKEAREAILKERQAILARLNYAKSNFERFKRLFKEEAATKEELERAQAEYLALKRQAQALERKERETVSRIKATESLLPYTQIKSPTEALVARRLVDQGSFVNVCQPLIYRDDRKAGFWLVAEIDESLLPFVSPDKEVVVTIPSLNKNLKAPVEVVVDHVSPQTRTFRIKVNLPIPIQAGLFARVYVPLEPRQALVVPQSAIFKRGDLTAVYVVGEDRTIRLRLVKTGQTFSLISGELLPYSNSGGNDLYVEILSGLNEGEKVIVGDLEKIKEGDVLGR